MIVAKPVMAEDLIDAPFDGMERYVVNGELREYPVGERNPETGELMPVRNRLHCLATTASAGELRNWLKTQP